MTRVACLAVVLLLCGIAEAVPPDGGGRSGGPAEEVQRYRSEAREAYERRREARRESLEQAARSSHAAPAVAVPGWRDMSDPGAEEQKPPVASTRRWCLSIWLAIAGVLIALLLLRIRLPWLFPPWPGRRRIAAFRRSPTARVPRTIRLRPLAERTTSGPRGPASGG